jgi:hypothetical protein
MIRKIIHLSFLLFALLVLGQVETLAASLTLDEHKAEIDRARLFIGEMLHELAEAEAGIAEFDHGPEDTADLRAILPLNIQVDTGNGLADVSFAWLHSGLDAFDRSQDIQEQAMILNEIDEKLEAISWNLEVIRNAAERALTKDEKKQKLAEILSRQEFQKPTVKEESVLEKWLQKIGDWIASLFPKDGPNIGSEGMGAAASVLRVVLIAAVVLLVGFGLYKLLPFLMPSRKRRRKKEREERVVLGEIVGAEETPQSLFDEAEQIALSGDLRGAIRKGYIALLCELGDRRLIGLARHRTNRDYLRDVSRSQDLYTEMRELTGIFERHWYGAEPGNVETWADFRARYKNTLRNA